MARTRGKVEKINALLSEVEDKLHEALELANDIDEMELAETLAQALDLIEQEP